MASQTPASQYNHAEIKFSLDASLPVILESFGYKETHQHSNQLLALGYLAALIALPTSAYSFLVSPLPESNWLMIPAVLAYSVVYAAYFYIQKFIVKDTIYTGTSSDSVVTVDSVMPRYSPKWTLTLVETKKGAVLNRYQETFSVEKLVCQDGSVSIDKLKAALSLLMNKKKE